ncbi:MAG: DNA polymerase III subunit gamma/tau, partial [Bacillota bacterium]|nr:DNA polymerase III subunit gamma/tau [Bacillota bacterium]
MGYLALYRKYRSRSFSELVGQPHISRVLAAAVKNDNIVHAYLFAGPRGTGKTSTAKILARAINCEQPLPSGDPCNSCAACRRDLEGGSMDVIEMDAASNRGIDEVRELREKVKYAPAADKYKVYIIDEVHMLTGEAFNALLKTLEEPPAHVVFILATTEAHKLPATILSRCQRFDFRRISEADIIAHLRHIAGAEQIEIDDEALRLLARKAFGGMRDAVSLLDQCSTVAEGPVSAATVTAMLGAADRDFISRLVGCLLQKRTTEMLAMIGQLVDEGKDLRAAVADILELCRDMLLSKLSAQGEPLPDWADNIAPAEFVNLLSALADTDAKLRYSPTPRISLELPLIKFCGLPPAPAAPPTPQPQPEARPAATAQP